MMLRYWPSDARMSTFCAVSSSWAQPYLHLSLPAFHSCMVGAIHCVWDQKRLQEPHTWAFFPSAHTLYLRKCVIGLSWHKYPWHKGLMSWNHSMQWDFGSAQWYRLWGLCRIALLLLLPCIKLAKFLMMPAASSRRGDFSLTTSGRAFACNLASKRAAQGLCLILFSCTLTARS